MNRSEEDYKRLARSLPTLPKARGNNMVRVVEERTCEYAREYGWQVYKIDPRLHRSGPQWVFISPRSQAVLVRFATKPAPQTVTSVAEGQLLIQRVMQLEVLNRLYTGKNPTRAVAGMAHQLHTKQGHNRS